LECNEDLIDFSNVCRLNSHFKIFKDNLFAYFRYFAQAVYDKSTHGLKFTLWQFDIAMRFFPYQRFDQV